MREVRYLTASSAATTVFILLFLVVPSTRKFPLISMSLIGVCSTKINIPRHVTQRSRRCLRVHQLYGSRRKDLGQLQLERRPYNNKLTDTSVNRREILGRGKEADGVRRLTGLAWFGLVLTNIHTWKHLA